MSLEPLLSATWIIQIHAFAALAALVLGTVQLVAPKGTVPHQLMGIIWLILMLIVAISSIFIRPSVFGWDLPFLQWFSFIHIFTISTLIAVGLAVHYLRQEGPAHRRHIYPIISIFIGGLIIAGAFTLLPGRIMGEVVFGIPEGS